MSETCTAEYVDLKSYIFELEKEYNHAKRKNNPLLLSLIIKELRDTKAKLRTLLLADSEAAEKNTRKLPIFILSGADKIILCTDLVGNSRALEMLYDCHVLNSIKIDQVEFIVTRCTTTRFPYTAEFVLEAKK